MRQQELQNVLVQTFAQAQAKRAGYSKRSFARQLGISHGSLIEIMNGKRKVSYEMATRICDRLLLAPEIRTRIFHGPTSAKESAKEIPASLSSDQFHVISEWHYFALLNLLKLKGTDSSERSMGQRLGIPPLEVIRALARLERMGLVKKSKGKWVRTKGTLQTSDEILSASIQKSHLGFLELASRKLGEVPVDRRDFTTMTMAIDSKKLKEAKRLIREFQDRLSALLEGSDSNDVYIFGTQLIPVTTEAT